MARGTWGGDLDIRPMRVNLAFRMGTTNAQTGFYLRDLSATPANPQSCAQHVYDNFGVHFKNILHTTDLLTGVDVVNMTTGEGGSVSPSNIVGTATGETLPTYVQVPCTMKGELRRRYGQGRGLWPVRLEAWSTADSLNEVGRISLQSVADVLTDQYIDVGLGGAYRLINVHGVLPSKAATPSRPARLEIPASWYDVTSLRLGTVLSFLRSRKVGVGS